MIAGNEIRNPVRPEDIVWLAAAGVFGGPVPAGDTLISDQGDTFVTDQGDTIAP
jgi:hypothetical protein